MKTDSHGDCLTFQLSCKLGEILEKIMAYRTGEPSLERDDLWNKTSRRWEITAVAYLFMLLS